MTAYCESQTKTLLVEEFPEPHSEIPRNIELAGLDEQSHCGSSGIALDKVTCLVSSNGRELATPPRTCPQIVDN